MRVFIAQLLSRTRPKSPFELQLSALISQIHAELY